MLRRLLCQNQEMEQLKQEDTKAQDLKQVVEEKKEAQSG